MRTYALFGFSFLAVVGAAGESLEQNIRTCCHFGYGVDSQRLCLSEPLAALYFQFGLKRSVRQKPVLLDVTWDIQGWSILVE